ncbi:MAG TPA: DUF4174 domain-containing protein [Acidobacteriaceae bacterium]|jgi:hypothetical protein|nr:DUF4174 domain-containing protein [Acidobacteriaceae bacterium]
MRRVLPHLATLLLLLSPGLHAQARPQCQVVPGSFAAMHGCFRPLLVFSPAPDDALLRRQIALLDHDADDMMDRFVLYTPVAPDPHRLSTPLDAPYTVLDAQQMTKIRARFHIPASQFTVLLLDEDGSVMLRSSNPVNPARLNALIDRTPLRQAEMRRPGAN